MGKEDHVPFVHLAVATLSLCSYPFSHVVLIMSSLSYQPLEFSVYFALGIVGGMQALSSVENINTLRVRFILKPCEEPEVLVCDACLKLAQYR